MIANNGQPCTSDHKLRGLRRPKTAAVGIGNALDVVGKIPRRQTMQASVNECSQLEINALRLTATSEVLAASV